MHEFNSDVQILKQSIKKIRYNIHIFSPISSLIVTVVHTRSAEVVFDSVGLPATTKVR